MPKKVNASVQKLSKSEKRKKLFFMDSKKIVSMPVNGHWNNDSGCRID